MAVINGITVTFEIDGRTAIEYTDEDTPAGVDVSNKFVEAVSEKRFGVKLAVPKTYRMKNNALCFRIYLDGKLAQGAFVRKSDLGGRGKSVGFWSWTADGSEKRSTGGLKTYPWIFAQIEEVEDQIPKGSKVSQKELKGLGTLVVEVSNHLIISESSDPTQELTSLASFKARKLDEKQTQKGGGMTHTTRLGQAKIIPDRPCLRTQQIGEIFATFNFKYRSHRALQSMMLIPRTPSPAPLDEANIDDLNADELRAMIRHQRAQAQDIKPTIRNLKRERLDDDEGIVSVRPAKSRPFVNGEIIDLDH